MNFEYLQDRVDTDPLSGLSILTFRANKDCKFDDVPKAESNYDPSHVLTREKYTFDDVMRRGRNSPFYEKQLQFEEKFVRPLTNTLCELAANQKLRQVQATGSSGALITSPNVFYQQMPGSNGARPSTNYISSVNTYSDNPFGGDKQFALTREEIDGARKVAGLSAFFTRPLMEILPPDHNYHTHTMTLHDVYNKELAKTLVMLPMYEHMKSAQADAMTDLLFPQLDVPDGNAIHGVRVSRSMMTAHYLENRADEAPTGLVEKTHMSTSMRVQQAGKSAEYDLRVIERPEGRADFEGKLVQISHATTRSLKLSCCVSLVQAAMPPSGHIDQKAGFLYNMGIFKEQEMNAIWNYNATNFLRLQKPPAQAGLTQFTKLVTDVIENYKDRGLEASLSNLVLVVDSKMYTWLGNKSDQPYFISGRQPRMTPNYSNMMTINGVRVMQMPEFPTNKNGERINLLRQHQSIGEFYPMRWQPFTVPDPHSYKFYKNADCDIRITNMASGTPMTSISFKDAVKNAVETFLSSGACDEKIDDRPAHAYFARGLLVAVLNTVVLNVASEQATLYAGWADHNATSTEQQRFVAGVAAIKTAAANAVVPFTRDRVNTELKTNTTLRQEIDRKTNFEWIVDMCLQCNIPLYGMNVMAVRPHITMQTYSSIAVLMGSTGNKLADAPGLHAIDTRSSAAGIHAANQSFVYSFVAVYGSMIHNPRNVMLINNVAVDKYSFGGSVNPYSEADIPEYKSNNKYSKDLFFMFIDDESLQKAEERVAVDIAGDTPYIDNDRPFYSPLAKAYADHFGWKTSKMQFNDVISVHNKKKKDKQTICFLGDYEVKCGESKDDGVRSAKWQLILGNGPRRGHVTKEALDVYKGVSPMFPAQPEYQLNISSGVKVY